MQCAYLFCEGDVLEKNGSFKGFFANWIADSGMHEVNLQWPVPNDRLQALRVHRLFAAPLGAGRMAQPGTDQHMMSTACPGVFALGVSAGIAVLTFLGNFRYNSLVGERMPVCPPDRNPTSFSFEMRYFPMHTKEVSELRRRWQAEKNAVKHIYGCYVNASGEIVADLDEPLSLMPQEEAEQYFSLLKKALSGKLGKNLLDLVFSTQQVADSDEHRLLMSLRDSELQDLEARQAFYQKAVESLHLEGSYLLLLAHDTYDVPTKAKDGAALEDGENVFSYILCAACPVKEGKPGLGYYAGDNEFHCFAPQTVAAPECGFLFPAFDDRAANLYNALFYCRKPDALPQEFIESVFHTDVPMAAEQQKETFRESLAEALGQSCSMDVVQVVYSQLDGMLTEHKESGREDPLTVTAKDLAHILQGCEVPEENIQAFQSLCDEKFGEGVALNPANLIEPGKVEIKTPQVSLTVEADYSSLVQTRVIDGQKYLLIPAGEGVEFNGLAVKIPGELEEAQKEGNGE